MLEVLLGLPGVVVGLHLGVCAAQGSLSITASLVLPNGLDPNLLKILLHLQGPPLQWTTTRCRGDNRVTGANAIGSLILIGRYATSLLKLVVSRWR